MLKYTSYSFTCTLLDEAWLPAYKGSTFRGALGGALKKVICTFKNRECSDCLLSKRCQYARIFETLILRDPTRPAQTIPHPYLIEPDPSDRTRYRPSDTFVFTLLLFGEFIDSLPYFIYAVETMGENGIGTTTSGNRARFCIESVTGPDGSLQYESVSKQLLPFKSPDFLASPELSSECHGSLDIRMITPLRFKNDNRFADAVSFQDLIRAALRRVSAMHATYGDGDPPLDYRSLVEAAAGVKNRESRLSWHDWKRYSNRQHDVMLFGGLLGNISFVGNIGPFMQIVEQAKILHIGKQTTFGLGAFDYRWEPDTE